MLKFLGNIDPLIIDVAVVAIIVLIVFFGALRGVKKTVVNFLIMGVSLFLGFCSYTSSIKNVILGKILIVEKILPAGSGNVKVFFGYLLSSLMVSLSLFLLIYLVLHMIVSLIDIILKRNRVGKRKTVVGRIFGAIISFAYGGVILLVFLFVLNSNIVGMKQSVSQTTITKLFIEKTDLLLSKIEPDLSTKIVLKVYKGDVMIPVNNEEIDAYNYFDREMAIRVNKEDYVSNIENVEFTKEETQKNIENYVWDLYQLSLISDQFDDSNPALKAKYVKMADELIALMNKTVNLHSLGELEFSLEEKGTIRSQLKDSGIGESGLELFDQIVDGAAN